MSRGPERRLDLVEAESPTMDLVLEDYILMDLTSSTVMEAPIRLSVVNSFLEGLEPTLGPAAARTKYSVSDHAVLLFHHYSLIELNGNNVKRRPTDGGDHPTSTHTYR
jgi:hypothetical protein